MAFLTFNQSKCTVDRQRFMALVKSFESRWLSSAPEKITDYQVNNLQNSVNSLGFSFSHMIQNRVLKTTLNSSQITARENRALRNILA